MKWKFTLVLALLNLVAFSTLYWLQITHTLRQEEAHRPALSIPLNSEVEKIDIRTKNGTYTIEHDDKHEWTVTHPVYWPANKNAIEHLLFQLRLIQPDATLSLKDIKNSGQTLEDFGLKNPAITLNLHTEQGTQKTFEIGTPPQTSNHLYLTEKNGNTIIATNKSLLQSLKLSPEQLYQQRIFYLLPFQVHTLTVESGESKTILVKENEQWKFKAPITLKASNTKVEEMIRTLIEEQPLDILTKDSSSPDRTGLNKPWMRISLSGNQKTDILHIGNTTQDDPSKRYARIITEKEQATFIIQNQTFEKLQKPLEILRDRQILHFKNANTIEITYNSKKVTLQKLEKRNAEDKDSWNCLFKKPRREHHYHTGFHPTHQKTS